MCQRRCPKCRVRAQFPIGSTRKFDAVPPKVGNKCISFRQRSPKLTLMNVTPLCQKKLKKLHSSTNSRFKVQYTRAHTYYQTNSHTHTQTQTHAQIQTHTHTHTHTQTHTCARANLPANLLAGQPSTCIVAVAATHKHAHRRTHTLTHPYP